MRGLLLPDRRHQNSFPLTPQVEIILEQETIIRFLMISVMNGRRWWRFSMAPESRPMMDFDLCIAETASKAYFDDPALSKGHRPLPESNETRENVSIKSLDRTFPAHADGTIADGSHLTLELLPKELEIVCA